MAYWASVFVENLLFVPKLTLCAPSPRVHVYQILGKYRISLILEQCRMVKLLRTMVKLLVHKNKNIDIFRHIAWGCQVKTKSRLSW
jgi:hypothetical protein